ncbi:MAG: hypothetical protein LQ345_001556 [Seirophora villosa]|nr:MAG: hypothetical protein LQ345_001556 [Seirophora villosa]
MGLLYALGSNACGQLGIGHSEDTSDPQLCHISDSGSQWPAPIDTIKGGSGHTLVQLESGDLYVSGSLKDGRACIDQAVDATSKFCKVPSTAFGGAKVKFCSALWEASTIVTDDNHIYTFGLGPKGELGVGEGVLGTSHTVDRFWPLEEQIIDLASGMSHTVVVLSSGDVYGWGNGRKGQLGEPAEIVWKPRKIPNLDFKVVRAVCGREFTYLVGDDEEGLHAVLGSDKWNIRSDAPAAIPGWEDVGASWGSIFVITSSGDFLSWGRDDHGQLGSDRRIEPFDYIAAGSEHALAITLYDNAVAWGWGEHGNCGHGIDEHGDVKGKWNKINPDTFGKASRVVGVAAGCATSFLWTQLAEGQSPPKLPANIASTG